MTTQTAEISVISAESLLEHWQGHRRLTRRTIAAFPEDKLFSSSVAGMRPFGELAWEFLCLTIPVVEGVATGEWKEYTRAKPTTKAELLALWDEQTSGLNAIFPAIPVEQFQKVEAAFGKWENTNIGTIQYAIDNENHHRGQGYVYLRSLGIEPPPFWERN